MSLEPRRTLAAALALALALSAGRARAQACCAGASAITPARLAPGEDQLVGIQAKAATLLGSYDDETRYRPLAAGSGEWDLEQSLFGAVRFAERAQLSLLVPFVETHRAALGQSATGGGVGDVNLGGRYDFTVPGRARSTPGLALLGGLTLPTGTPPDGARRPLATDATGIGAIQGSVGGALEERVGPFMLGLSAIGAVRTSRSIGRVDETLGPQLTGLASVAYTTERDLTLATAASVTREAAARAAGSTIPSSARTVTQATLAALYPLSEGLRVQGSAFINPPATSLGQNQPAALGALAGAVATW